MTHIRKKHPVSQPLFEQKLRLLRYTSDALKVASLPGAQQQAPSRWRISTPIIMSIKTAPQLEDTACNSSKQNNDNDSSTTTLLTFKPQNTQQGAQNGDNSGFDDRFVVEVDGEDDGEDADIEDDDNNDRDDGRDSPGATPGDTNQVNRDDAEVPNTQNAFPSTFDFKDDSSDNGVDADNSAPSNKFPPKRRKAVHLAFHPTPPPKKNKKTNEMQVWLRPILQVRPPTTFARKVQAPTVYPILWV